jgi:iron complex transport system ATP-binding protein
MTPLLEVDRLRFTYGRRSVLDEVSFSASAGEFIAIVGVNGAGKSTLLDLLAGIRKPSGGAIRIAGHSLASFGANAMARRVSHLPQTIHADLPFTAGQIVAMGRYPHTDRWFESEEDQQAMVAAMERTGCTRHRDRRFASLSGGERQRVLLAACLAQDAAIQLLDEPSTYLDIEAQLECFSLLRAEAGRGKLAFAVTHDLNLALTYASRLLLLEGGRLARQIDCARVTSSADWLGSFSPRLRMGETPAGTPWVWYE